MNKTAPLPALPSLPTSAEGIRDLVRRAEKGDQKALPALRELLKDPAAVDLLGGNLAREAQLTLINKFSGQNLLLKESLTRKLQLLQAELAGPNPTPLERLLVERVVTCWLHLYHLEQAYAQKDSMVLELATYYHRSINLTQKRYLSAIKTLALIRKLAVPVLQVNIARKQVNVAGPHAVPLGDAPDPKTLLPTAGKWGQDPPEEKV